MYVGCKLPSSTIRCLAAYLAVDIKHSNTQFKKAKKNSAHVVSGSILGQLGQTETVFMISIQDKTMLWVSSTFWSTMKYRCLMRKIATASHYEKHTYPYHMVVV